MKILLVTGAAFVMASAAAQAADLPQRAPPPPPIVQVAPVFTFTGPYIGANVGYGGDSYRYPLTLAGPASSITTANASLNSSGILGGGQIGYNYELPMRPLGEFGSTFVVGVEGDMDAASIRGNSGLVGTSPLVASNATGQAGTRVTAFGTARGRVGFTIGRALFYGTGGYAFAQGVTNSTAVIGNVGTITASTTRTHSGYAFGGGIEYLVTPNVSFKVEYLRAVLDTKIVASNTTGIRTYVLGEKPTENIIRAGVNYRFDIFGANAAVPVVARY